MRWSRLARLGVGRIISGRRIDPGPLKFRFVVASDLHYGLNNPDFKVGGYYHYQDRLDLLISALEYERDGAGIDFFIINGDVVNHVSPDFSNSTQMLIAAKPSFDSVGVPYYMTPGNHDPISDENWFNVLGTHRSTSFEHDDFGFILLDSSDLTGDREICIDDDFLQAKLTAYEDKRGVIFASHIPRSAVRNPGNGPQCGTILSLLKSAKNLAALFYGHVHERDGKYTYDGMPAFFDGHIAHFGLPYWGYRTVEVHENAIVTTQLNLITKDIRNRDVVKLPQ